MPVRPSSMDAWFSRQCLLIERPPTLEVLPHPWQDEVVVGFSYEELGLRRFWCRGLPRFMPLSHFVAYDSACSESQ